MADKWNSILQWISLIHDEDMKKTLRLYMGFHKDKFVVTPGSISRHHSHKGGLMDHTLDVISIAHGIAAMLFRTFDVIKDWSSFHDKIIFCAMVHDVGKTRDYIFVHRTGEWIHNPQPGDHSSWFLGDWMKRMSIALDEDIREAILTHHGGWSTTNAQMTHLLSSVIHGADLISSRMKRE